MSTAATRPTTDSDLLASCRPCTYQLSSSCGRAHSGDNSVADVTPRVSHDRQQLQLIFGQPHRSPRLAGHGDAVQSLPSTAILYTPAEDSLKDCRQWPCPGFCRQGGGRRRHSIFCGVVCCQGRGLFGSGHEWPAAAGALPDAQMAGLGCGLHALRASSVYLQAVLCPCEVSSVMSSHPAVLCWWCAKCRDGRALHGFSQ